MEENKMGTVKVPKLIIQTGIPLMLSLLINSLYNFVDSVFVSYVSEDALTALSLVSPIQVLISAAGLGIAVGLNAVISRALGEKNEDHVKKAAQAALFLALIAGISISVIGVLISKPYFAWQSGGNKSISKYGMAYLDIVVLFAAPNMGQWVFDRFVISSGKSNLFLFTLSAASITNLILDPIFIFGYFGLPAMGTAGAALATGIGQCMGCLAGLLINLKFNKEIPISFSFKPDKNSITSILKVGLPSALVQSITSVLGIVMNSVLIGFSSTAVAVYGACTKIQNLSTVGVHGIDNGVIPIVAYNYGARKYPRIHESVRWAMTYSLIIFAVFLVFLEGFPSAVMKLFDASDEMMAIGIPALKILSVAWLISIPCLVLGSSLQGLSRGTDSMILTLTRQAVLPLILVVILSNFANLNLIWISFCIAETVTIPLGIVLWKRAVKLTLK